MTPSGKMPMVTKNAEPLQKDRPRIGVGVIIVRDGRVLLGKRRNAHGDGQWSYPGGHLEHGESWQDCAARELLEETGLVITKSSFVFATNDVFLSEGKHYVTLFMKADCPDGEAVNREPEKCTEWRWFSKGELPESLFLPIRNHLQNGYDPFAQ